MKFDEFNWHIGNPSYFAIGFQRTDILTRIYIGLFGRVWLADFSLTNWNNFDWTDDNELQMYLLKTKRDFKHLTKEEKRKFQWGWLEVIE
jgi:hypothetical protein